MLKQTPYATVLGRFAASLVDPGIVPIGVDAATSEHMGIYRNNIRLNRIAALTDAFVNVVKLVGEDYFGALARAYVDCTGAKSANLHDDGAALPAFIRGFSPAADLPYLGDVAEVDWRLHRAYFAPDSDAVDSATIAELGPERFGAASMRFAPSVELVRSLHWPIADILNMHAGGPLARLDAGGQAVLIWREAFAVQWQPLGAAEVEALAALMTGIAVENAFAETGADADWLFSQLFGRRLVQAIEVPHHEDQHHRK